MKKGRALLYSYDTTMVEKYHNLLFHLQTKKKKEKKKRKALLFEGSKRGKKKEKNTDKGEGTGQNRAARQYLFL